MAKLTKLLICGPYFSCTCLFVNFFANNGELTHTTSKERNATAHPSYINYHLKSEASIMLHFQLHACAVWDNYGDV